MRALIIAAIFIGSIAGSAVSFYAMRPLASIMTQRTSVLSADMNAAVQLRGVILGVDTSTRTMTIRVFYPAFTDNAAPFRISFDAIQNFSNFDDSARTYVSGREYISSAKVGQVVTMTLLRKPGSFMVLSLNTRTPTSSSI